MPFTSEDFECLADDEDDIDVQSSTKSLKHSLTGSDVIDTDEVSSRSHDCVKDIVGTFWVSAVFE